MGIPNILLPFPGLFNANPLANPMMNMNQLAMNMMVKQILMNHNKMGAAQKT